MSTVRGARRFIQTVRPSIASSTPSLDIVSMRAGRSTLLKSNSVSDGPSIPPSWATWSKHSLPDAKSLNNHNKTQTSKPFAAYRPAAAKPINFNVERSSNQLSNLERSSNHERPKDNLNLSNDSELEAKPRRKLRPRKAAITLTNTAVLHLRDLLQQPHPQMIRIGVKNRGCSGLTYHLEYVDKPGKFDEEIVQDGVKVLIDSKALFSIIGSEMDWIDDKLSSRFVFHNPNSKGQCGCGESFMV